MFFTESYPKVKKREFIKYTLAHPVVPLQDVISEKDKLKMVEMMCFTYKRKSEHYFRKLTVVLTKYLMATIDRNTQKAYKNNPSLFVESKVLTYTPLNVTVPPVKFKPNMPDCLSQKQAQSIFDSLPMKDKERISRLVTLYLTNASKAMTAQRYAVNFLATTEIWHDLLIKNPQLFSNFFYHKTMLDADNPAVRNRV